MQLSWDMTFFFNGCLGQLVVRKDDILQLGIDAAWIPATSLKSYPHVLY